jgi:hypothetical protein
MCDGEDRVVVVKKKAGRVGERRCYKAQCVSAKCTNGIQDVGKIAWGRFSLQGFFEVEKGSDSGGALLGSYAPLSCWELFALSLLCSPMLPIAGPRIG